MVDPLTGSYLAATAANMTSNILQILGKKWSQSLTETPRQQALQRCYQAALAALLPEDDLHRVLYEPLLEAFLAEPSVTAELAKLVRGHTPDSTTLLESFADITAGHTLPSIDINTRLAASVEAFLQVAEQETVLASTMQTAQLRQATQSLRAMATDLQAIRQAVALVTPRTGDVSAARDVNANNLVTGTQINHIVNLYQGSGGTWDAADYQAALERYLAWLAAATGRVVLRGIQRAGQQAVELSLQDVYVPLAAEPRLAERQLLKQRLAQRVGRSAPSSMDAAAELGLAAATPERIPMQALLQQGERLVVIGAPGCGKTTVLQHIAWTLAEALRTNQPVLATERLGLSSALPLPIYVPLSLYADHRRQFARAPEPQQRQLATFINHYLIERQAGLRLPDDFFATLLNQGQHVLLLLDGLDEVPNEDERALVAQAVRDLTHGRPQARLVVTSRTQAYQGKAVLGEEFRVVQVLPLDPEHVKDLIHRAYHAIYPAEVERDSRERQATELVDGVTRLEAERAARLGTTDEQRLVTTPLLVRMLLIVHFNMRRLPDQRAELYMAMVDTLLTSDYHPDEMVAQRLARLGGDWRRRRDMLQHLAFHMHSQGQDAGREISEAALVDRLCAYLCEQRQMQPEEAAALVNDLVTASRQRGGLLEERGGLYRFNHLSIQEFLTARYLAEVERDVGRIVAFFEARERLTDSWWRETILLTGGYLHVTASDVTTQFLQRLAHAATPQPPHTAAAMAAAELASTTFVEWGGTEATQRTLADRLVALVTDPSISQALPRLRAAIGEVLARLGDPRAGVGVRGQVPDLAWCSVPAGAFLLGSSAEDREARGNEKPQHRLTLPAFFIARYPITNAQFAPFIAAGGYEDKQWWTEAGWAWRHGAKPDLSGIDDKDLRETYTKYLAQRPVTRRHLPFLWDDERFNMLSQPVVGVSWYEAMAYCAWLHQQFVSYGEGLTIASEALEKLLGTGRWQVRLPTEAEWEKAAGWEPSTGQQRRYAWGDTWEATKANAEQQIGKTSAVGVFPAGAAACGALDMMGNVWEWNLSHYVAYPYKLDAWHNPAGEANRVLRGGSWYVDTRYARVSSRNYLHPAYFDFNAGMRVVVAPVL